MARLTQQRMTKRSRLRAIAKRALPERLLRHRRRTQAIACQAKRPGLPRWRQRLLRIEARELAQQQAQARDSQFRAYIENLQPQLVAVQHGPPDTQGT